MQFTFTRTDAADTDRTDGLLRIVLKVDALVTATNGLAYLAFAPILDNVLRIPQPVQYAAGMFLLFCGLTIAIIASRRTLDNAATAAIIALNLVWFVASMTVVALGVWSTTVIGTAWLIVQGVTVGAVAVLQLIGRSRL